MKDMKLIMESWRNFTEISNEEIVMSPADLDRVHLLKEGKLTGETTISLLIERYEKDEITGLQAAQIINESIEYEYSLLPEGIVDDIVSGLGKGVEKMQAGARKARDVAKEKFFNVIYGGVGKFLKYLAAQKQKAAAATTGHLQKIQVAAKKKDVKAVAQLTAGAGLKLLVKGLKFLGKALMVVVKGIAGLIQKAGRLMQHPAVKVLVIVCLLAAFATMVTTAGPVAAMVAGPGRGLASQALKATTGKGLAGQAIAGAGKVAKVAGKAAFGTDEKGEMLQEAEELIGLADIIGDLDIDTIGAAIVKLAADLEGKEVFSVSTMSQMATSVQKAGEAEEYVEKSKYLKIFADEALGLQSDALGNLQDIHQKMMQGELDQLMHGGWSKDLAEVMQSAIKVAANHCKEDPTACEGASALGATIKQTWSGIVESETMSVATQSNKMVSDLISTSGTQTGATTVGKLGAAAADLAAKMGN